MGAHEDRLVPGFGFSQGLDGVHESARIIPDPVGKLCPVPVRFEFQVFVQSAGEQDIGDLVDHLVE